MNKLPLNHIERTLKIIVALENDDSFHLIDSPKDNRNFFALFQILARRF